MPILIYFEFGLYRVKKENNDYMIVIRVGKQLYTLDETVALKKKTMSYMS